LENIFQKLSANNDPEWLFIDGSIVKAHQDSGGLPVYFELSCGQVHDVVHAKSLIAHSPHSSVVTADKGYDSDDFREHIRQLNSQPNIPRKGNSKTGNPRMDWCLYKYRHLVENAFMKIKKYRGLATRYEKLARNYSSNVTLAFMMMWLPMMVE